MSTTTPADVNQVVVKLPGLYEAVLGDAWSKLDPALQRFHQQPGERRASGTFQVRHGRWPAAWIAWLAGMPAAGEQVALDLRVIRRGEAELWRRTFAGKLLLSEQFAGTDGWLVERVGATELLLRLDVKLGELHLHSGASALCWGAWRLWFPAWLSPRVTARERALGTGQQLEIQVQVELPLLGKLISYGGTLLGDKCESHGPVTVELAILGLAIDETE